MNIVGGRETNQDTNQDTNITFSNTMVSKCNLDSRNHFLHKLVETDCAGSAILFNGTDGEDA